jgi:hypothetical protein
MSEEHESSLAAKNSRQTESASQAGDLKQNSGNDSRRKFIKGAAAATPIILSVASRPVWARNCSLSGQLSGNLSNQDNTPCYGEGCTVSFWSQQGNLFHPQYPANMWFIDAFGRNAFPGKTLYDVISGNILPPDVNIPTSCTAPTAQCRAALQGLGEQAVAALQNSASPIRYDLDVATVILSFQQSFDAGTALAMEDTKTAFFDLNNQYCPIP